MLERSEIVMFHSGPPCCCTHVTADWKPVPRTRRRVPDARDAASARRCLLACPFRSSRKPPIAGRCALGYLPPPNMAASEVGVRSPANRLLAYPQHTGCGCDGRDHERSKVRTLDWRKLRDHRISWPAANASGGVPLRTGTPLAPKCHGRNGKVVGAEG